MASDAEGGTAGSSRIAASNRTRIDHELTRRSLPEGAPPGAGSWLLTRFAAGQLTEPLERAA
jgi:hypothetical protein